MSRGIRSRTHAVILAGGAGQRFWPKSRQKYPKPFLQVVDGKSLLESTLQRARKFAPKDQIWIVCGKSHASAVRRESGLPSSRVLVEPQARNTAMAVGLVAERVAAEDPSAVLAVLPADHRVPDSKAFAAAIRNAANAAAGADVLVTLGVRPTRPDTGYGYIQLGAAAGADYPGLCQVRRFVEKPDAGRAKRYLRSGNFLWNAGVFVWSAEAILREIQACAPAIHRALAPVRRCPRGRGAREAIERAYRKAPSQPIDIAVLEQSKCVWTLPVEFHWSDVGTWASLAAELGVRAGVNQVLGGEVLFDDAGGNLVWADGRPVVLLGVQGLAVIDAGDAVLVAQLDRSPEVKRVVEQLRSRGRDELL